MIDRSLNYGRHIIENFAKRIHIYNSVLDIGAGSGDDLMVYKKINPAAELFAVECYKPNIEQLIKKGIKVYDFNIEKDALPLDNESIDIVNANQILEHVKEIFWVFHNIARVLKVGGYFVIGVPNLASLHNRILLMIGKQPTSIRNYSAHVRGFTKSDIIKFTKIWGGYKLIDFQGSNFYPFPPIVAKPLSKILPNMSVSIFFLFKKVCKYNDEFIRYIVENPLETNFYGGE